MALQSKEADCGKAVTREILARVFHDDDFQTVELKEECWDFLSIRTQLEEFGCRFISFDVPDLSQVEKKQLPAIALIQNGDAYHFVVILSLSKKKVRVFDPQFGEYILPLNEFMKVFLGKMLLKNKVGKKPKLGNHSLLTTKEKMLYGFFFVWESISACLLFHFTNVEDGFIFTVVAAVSLLMGILLQNTLNNKVRNRMDGDILLPYMTSVGQREDFPVLAKMMNAAVYQVSSFVSYSTLCVAFMFLLLMNGYYLSFLALIAIVFSLIQYPLELEKNKVNRFCSLNEKFFLENLGKCDGVAINYYQKAKNKSQTLLLTYVATWVLEAIVLSIFIFMELQLEKVMNVNAFIFYLGLTLTFSLTLTKMLKTIKNDEKITSINQLSYSLWSFLLKSKTDLKYNNTDKGEVKSDEIQPCIRVSEPGEQRKRIERDL